MKASSPEAGPRSVAVDRQPRAEHGGIKPEGLVVAGSLFGAIGAASCCILPLVLFALGVGGAWIGALVALEPYQPIFVAITLAFLAAGYWLVYRRPKAACAEGETCARPLPSLFVRASLWSATVLVAGALAFPYAVPALLGT